MKKANNVIRVPGSLDGSFFKYWFLFLRPFHNLADKEIDVIASFAKERYRLSKHISDPDLLDKMTWNKDIRDKVREDCNMTLAHFHVVISKLKKKGVIIDERINPKFIPNISEEDGYFQLLLLFELK